MKTDTRTDWHPGDPWLPGYAETIVPYAAGRAERLAGLLRLAADPAESDESRRIALENARDEIGILAGLAADGAEAGVWPERTA